ncbi:unnamed protein product [Triticum turgidum subsp. durum]|uniref:Uncharacterized protein n=1 Tax=Triticum turgidum subsp. durum TaxID=4567 RepID=A0A9R0VP85_TRITD|nr:unnamed protein product [Triticum turgidum subsp. durum]
MWDRKANCYGVAVWVLRKSIGLQKLLGLGFKIERNWSHIVRYAEHVHALFLWVHSSLFIVQLESMQPKELFKSDPMYTYYPFTSFYDEGNCWDSIYFPCMFDEITLLTLLLKCSKSPSELIAMFFSMLAT